MMSRERAEKILQLCCIVYGDDMREKVAAQIEEAVMEAFTNAALDSPRNRNIVLAALLNAKAEAFEEAAKIVEAFEPLRGLRPDIEKHDEGMREMLASNIRARAKEVGK